MLGSCVRDRHLLPKDQSMDVLFHEFMDDEMGMVERIYALAGQPLTSDSRRAMQEFVDEHPRGMHGRVAYDLADFEIDAEERREKLAPYVERFGIRLEDL